MRFLRPPKVKGMGKFLDFIVPRRVLAICLAPFGIYSDNLDAMNAINTQHEEIHWKQQIEMLIIFFYLWYVIEWLIRKIKYKKEAYYNISFEREAHENDAINNYVIGRKPYAWIKNL